MGRSTSDFLRLFSMLAVLVIHATGKFEWQFINSPEYMSDRFLAVILNQLSRFSVPVFVMLSGYVLALRYGKHVSSVDADISSPLETNRPATLPALDFYRRRLYKIALPFVIWSLVFLYVYRRFIAFSYNGWFLYNAGVLYHALFFESAEYHLYFLTIILWCYLFFPLLMRVRSLTLLFIFFLILFFYISPGHLIPANLGVKMISFPSSFFIYWLGYFYLGIFSAFHETKLRNFLKDKSYLPWLLIIPSFIWMMTQYVLSSAYGGSPGNFNHFHRASVLLYSVGVWTFFWSKDASLTAWIKKDERRTEWIKQGSSLSFFVYFFHTVVLRVMEKSFPGEEVLLISCSLIVFMFGFAFLINRYMPRNPLLRRIFALPEE